MGRRNVYLADEVDERLKERSDLSPSAIFQDAVIKALGDDAPVVTEEGGGGFIVTWGVYEWNEDGTRPTRMKNKGRAEFGCGEDSFALAMVEFVKRDQNPMNDFTHLWSDKTKEAN